MWAGWVDWSLVFVSMLAPRPSGTDGPAEPIATATERHAVLIGRLVERGDSAAVEYTLLQLDRGMPPEVLEAFLDAALAHPQSVFVPQILALTKYRMPNIRARAILALAGIADQGAKAAFIAMDDPDMRIRRLGLQLTELYTDPAVEEAALLLRTREPALMQEP